MDFAEATFLRARAYDRVFSVFDRDDHRTYHDALNRIAALDRHHRNDENEPVPFVAIPSVPCFELWLLLHYEDVQAFWHRDDVIRSLRRHLQNYEKGARDVYARTEPHLPLATERASRLQGRFGPASGTDPYTKADEVTTLLRSNRATRP